MIKLIISNSTNPFYNLAIEEWAVRNIDTSQTDYLFLYQNTDCVVVGRNQNIFQEVNLKYCKENNISICRRVSGGGTVFHDLGNLNWSFITKFETEKVNNYKEFSSSIISALKIIGLSAYLNKRNAILIDSYKISGQAQFTNRKNLISHGTLLFDSDIEKLNNSTITKDIQVNTKATKSIRSEVKTINQLLNTIISIDRFKKIVQKENNCTKLFDIGISEIQNSIKKIEQKYCASKWIYERSSKCTIEQTYKKENIILEIEKAKIISVKNKKGEEINHHPLINMCYLDSLFCY